MIKANDARSRFQAAKKLMTEAALATIHREPNAIAIAGAALAELQAARNGLARLETNEWSDA